MCINVKNDQTNVYHCFTISNNVWTLCVIKPSLHVQFQNTFQKMKYVANKENYKITTSIKFSFTHSFHESFHNLSWKTKKPWDWNFSSTTQFCYTTEGTWVQRGKVTAKKENSSGRNQFTFSDQCNHSSVTMLCWVLPFHETFPNFLYPSFVNILSFSSQLPKGCLCSWKLLTNFLPMLSFRL